MCNICLVTEYPWKYVEIANLLTDNNYTLSFSSELVLNKDSGLFLIDQRMLINGQNIEQLVEANNVLILCDQKSEISNNYWNICLYCVYPIDPLYILKTVEKKYSQEEPVIKPEQVFIGVSNFTTELRNKIVLLGRTETNILITGESGTGKEVVAKLICENSTRANKPFVKINCSAIPESLLESELFGYVKGAFTGAVKDYPGKLLYASNGTILLDEIGDMPLLLQAKLLRVIEENIVYPLGSNEGKEVYIKYIFATNKNLTDAVYSKTFREDLYYRINAIELKLDPLRDRKEDIPILIDHFLKKYTKKYKKAFKSLRITDLQLLYRYDWPGNVRELEHFVERVVIYSSKDSYPDIKSIPLNINDSVGGEESDLSNYRDAMNSFERYLITSFLSKNKWNINETAIELGLERTNLYKKLRKLDITKNDQ